MPSVSLTGEDTLILSTAADSLTLVDVADGDWFVLNFDNDLAALKRGKNGNVIAAENSMGLVGTATLRVLRGSNDDKVLDSWLQSQLADFSAFLMIGGSFTKRVGDGQGNITGDTGIMSGGIFKRAVNSMSNAEANTDQSVAVYQFEFADVQRAVA